MGAQAWPRGDGLGLPRVRVSMARASMVRVLAQRETGQAARMVRASKVRVRAWPICEDGDK